jgi:hypothetical protein
LENFMTTFRASLLGSAAVFAATAASAADLPTKKAAPVEYVRVCSVHGTGFFYIPGTDTCIRLSGRVRADFITAQPANYWGTASFKGGVASGSGTFYAGRNMDATGFEANGRLNVDVRTSTEYGTLRAYFRYDLYRDTGVFASTSSSLVSINGGVADTPGLYYTGLTPPTQTSAASALDVAYIQWAGITAGRNQSFFDFYANALSMGKIAGADRKTQLFAYTATFGGGFSATLSLEDQTASNTNPRYVNPQLITSTVKGDVLYRPWFGSTANFCGAAPAVPTPACSTGGTRVPDVVGVLRYDGSWGSAQLSAALHQQTYAALTDDGALLGGAAFPYADGVTAANSIIDSDWGWAIQGGVKINLPMLAKGDQLWLQASYADGALSYLSGRFTGWADAQGVVADHYLFPVINAQGQFTGQWNAESARGYALTAALLHYWVPTVRQALFGSYLHIDNPASTASYANFNGVGDQTFTYGAPDITVWQVGTNVLWSPVAGLDIGPEVMYVNTDAGARPLYKVTSADGDSSWVRSGSQDRLIVRFRIQREF